MQQIGKLGVDWNGGYFQQWRKAMRLTQAEAAHLLGVTRRAIVKWEAAPTNPVSRAVTLACFYIAEHQSQIAEALADLTDDQKKP
jgi:DNA-binding XRE family transcriptional regulator